jgi:hypothetical protein
MNAHDPIDTMLNQARWPEAKLDAHARLASAYRAERSRVARRTTFARTAVALAASVMIVFAVARFAGVDQPTTPHPARVTAQPAGVDERVPMVVRPPTNLETAILETQRPRQAKSLFPAAKNPSVNVDVSAIARELETPDLPVERRQILLVRLLESRSSEAMRTFLDSVARGAPREVSLAALDGVKEPPVEKLIASLRDPVVDRRIAAARALGYINGPAVTSRLIRMAEADVLRREAMIALACSRGERAQEYLKHAAEAGPMVSLARSVRLQFDVR